MGNVMVIPAKRQVGNTARQQDAKPKLRVAAYCRVSTDSDEQATSYDAQVEHYTEFIQKTQNGQVQVNHNHFLGYTKDADGNLIIDPEQAEVVKRIYREYLEGYSMDRIAKGLEADGILTGAGKTKWWTSTINKILRNEKYIVWRCISRLEPTGQECHARTVNEPVLENVVVQAINTLLGDKSTYQTQLQQNIAKVIRSTQQNTADGIDERLQELQKELLKKANNKEAYDEIADEIFKLREQREKCTVDTVARDAQIARINELQDFIKQQPAHLEAFDEVLVKRLLERIIV